MSTSLEEWAKHLESYADEVKKVEGGLHVILDSGRRKLPLGEMPPDASVTVEPADGLDQLELTVGSTAPRQITVDASGVPSLERVQLSAHNVESLRVAFPADAGGLVRSVRVRPGTVDRLSVSGRAKMELSAPNHIELSDTDVKLNLDWKTQTLVLSGSVRITGATLTCESLSILKTAEVTAQELQWDEVEEGGEQLVLHRGNYHGRCFCFDGRLTLDRAEVSVQEAGPCSPEQTLVVDGAGSFTIARKLTRTDLQQADDGQLILILTGGAEALDLQGRATVQCARRSVVAGDPQHPLRIRQVLEVEDAELHQVDLYSLGVGDLAHLSQAERVAPWIPRQRRRAKKKEDAMTLGLDDDVRDTDHGEQLWLSRRAHFWARLSAILKSTHADGRTQSETRYAAMRTRRVALGRTSERFLLELYRLVGYGERIGWPLMWFAAISAWSAPMWNDQVLATGGTGRIFIEWLVGFGRALISPFSFFRFGDVLTPQGHGSEWAALLVRVLGIVLIFFALSAGRRRTKAE